VNLTRLAGDSTPGCQLADGAIEQGDYDYRLASSLEFFLSDAIALARTLLRVQYCNPIFFGIAAAA
jgi:hypothetical protein